jgi:hypothetical protein
MAASRKVAFVNGSDGPRGVNGVNGLVLIDAGKRAEVEVTEAEFNSAKSTGYFGAADDDDGPEPGPLDQSIPKLIEHLAAVDDPDEVQRLIDAETAGKSRDGALAALKERLEALLNA